MYHRIVSLSDGFSNLVKFQVPVAMAMTNPMVDHADRLYLQSGYLIGCTNPRYGVPKFRISY